MGYACNDLIAPAVLYLNPKITRNEFSNLLDQTHSSCFKEYSPEEVWDSYNPRFDDQKFKGGLEGLASILYLEENCQFRENMEPRIDENGLIIEPLLFLPLPEENGKQRYVINLHQGNKLLPINKVREYSWEKLGIGDIWTEVQLGYTKGRVVRVLNETYIDEEGGPQYEYEMEIQIIEPEIKEKIFETKEEVYKAYPIFNPINRFNWSQNSGSFGSQDSMKGLNKFHWINKRGNIRGRVIKKG